jgi:deoxyribonuclease-4
MSIAGGMDRAVERALRVGSTALQVFCKSANQWRARPFAGGEVDSFRHAVREAGLERHTLAHSSYLINLASPDDRLWGRSIEALVEEVERCGDLGIPFLVLHPGSHVGSGESVGLARVSTALELAVDRANAPQVRVLLENTAGQGTNLGFRFEHLGALLRTCGRGERLGVCFDTCHAFAAGYDFRDAHSWQAMWREFDRCVGIDRLAAFHLNDSKGDLGSRLDRHEHIGKGKIGAAGFRMLVRETRFRDLPMVLETPKDDDLRQDRRNLAVLRELAG